MALADDNLTTEEQQLFEQMRADDAAPPAAQPAPIEDRGEPVLDVPEVEAEPVAQPQSDAEPAERPGWIPASRFKEEADRRKAAEREFNEYRQRTEDRFAQILQRIGQPQPQPGQQQPAAPEIPALDKDPIGHFQARLAQSEQIIGQLTQNTQVQFRQSNEAAVREAVRMTAQAQENEFRSATPDYNDAAAFLKQSRHQELTDLGFINAAEREAYIGQEALQIASRAIQQGRNAPEMIYQLAQRRGFKPAAVQSNGQQQQAAPAEAPGDRLQRQASGQQQARSLGTARGSAPAPAMTAQRLIDLPEAQFAAMVDKATPEQLRNIFGE